VTNWPEQNAPAFFGGAAETGLDPAPADGPIRLAELMSEEAMPHSELFLSPSEAAARLGVSAKALRLYEARGLLAPVRSTEGWRAYGPEQMARAAEIVALRGLGFSLAQVERVLRCQAEGLQAALAEQETALGREMQELAARLERLRALRGRIAGGEMPEAVELAAVVGGRPLVAFDLPWPWAGERFEVRGLRPVTYITGPLGSGKTRFARQLAEALPEAGFLEMERGEAPQDPALAVRVEAGLRWLEEDGAVESGALTCLMAHLEAQRPAALVVDLIEHTLDEPTQAALGAWLRRRPDAARPLYVITRSSALLDLAALGPGDLILYCPANHGPPLHVVPIPGAKGYEAVETCLAAPVVRARTEGVVAMRPPTPVRR